jgi:AraC family transcriptional regulator
VIFYLSAGVASQCVLEGRRQRRTQTRGDFDVVPAQMLATWEDAAPTEAIAIRFTPERLARAAEALGVAQPILRPRLAERDPLVEPIAQALLAELAAPLPADRLYADGLGLALIARLLQGDPVGEPGRRLLSQPRLRRLVEYIETHLDTDLRLDDLADVTGLSASHLSALFRRTTGRSLHAYVVERRVERARLLLQDRRLSIAMVALEAGFSHQSHMSRWMRRLIGVTPAQLRSD